MQTALKQYLWPCQTIIQCTAVSARNLRSCCVTANVAASRGPTHGGQRWVTLANTCTLTLEVKHSKFIATAWPIQSTSEAMQLLERHADRSASHNCFAYKLCTDMRSSDDGEPVGGAPMLTAIEAEGLDGVFVLVTRFFGGTKLGTGGLARAYGKAARDCLQQAQRREAAEQRRVELQLPIQYSGSVYSLLDCKSVRRLHEDFAENGDMQLVLEVDCDELAALTDSLNSATKGQVQIKVST